MTSPSARLLTLLSLLQTGAGRTGGELATRLGVSARTVRADIERLRELGYPVDAVRGSVGGYRLGAGGHLPPLLLDDEEAVAVTVGLQMAAGVTGVEESGARALAKLEQVLPSRLRPLVDALGSTIDRGQENTGTDAPDPEVDAAVLGAVAAAIRDAEWLRFDYQGEPVLVEPYRLLSWQRRWHLVARDPVSAAWGTYRVDWMSLRMPTRRRFDPQPLEGGDYTAFAMRTIAASGWAVHARLRIDAPAQTVLDRINPTVGVVEPVDAEHCVLVTGADSLDTVAAYIGMLMMDFTVESPPELIPRLRVLSERYARAVAGS
ncbi:helix-turn-helix transcriptional regulator [Microbacterium azadirachtae]|nr:WYL domain-containing protein [Microbacterium azadirachtae]SDM19859.1 Predicted DNA-binding transcriptional regulator YafY, contains an HTH and WYL domains [Microbacterium azadirachtae]SEG42323.1 Predicted DNA-binding transcriptional regulator YafY, contains an HTH and WYL domains [Microbacterium azadirachtae]SEG45432.1 Predicted DNA-binding transcriptional regulator YafY, contains an HTH and WYL domains [Microbacterium azadirachtae]